MTDYDFSNPILRKGKEFLSDRKNSNNLIDILSVFENVNKVEPAHILAIQLVFEQLNKKNQLSLKGINEGHTEYKYRNWLLNCYNEGFSKLCNTLLKCIDVNLQKQLLSTLIVLLEIEKQISSNNYLQKLTDVIRNLVNFEGSIRNLLPLVKEYLEKCDTLEDDIWKSLSNIVKRHKESPPKESVSNVISIVECFDKDTKKISKKSKSKDEAATKEVKKCTAKVWEWLARNYSKNTLKLLLIILLEQFLPRLHRPIFLTDFLVNTLNAGGATSLLALQGIYVLILKHNIDYPNIYGKLYTMLQPEIFRTKYKARFFYLLDLFLTSTHLPQNMVASFIKKLARLALKAPPHDILMLLPFICNLFIRHPSLQKLFNHQDGPVEVDNDPFIMEESDPTLSRALESSLWEVKLLQNHVLPSVSRAAMFIDEPLPSVEWDLSDKLEMTTDKIYDTEKKKKQKTMSVTFEKPSSINVPRGLEMDEMWCI